MSSIAQNESPWQRVRVLAADIKLSHSVFALPFALLAAFMAAVPASARMTAGGMDWQRFAGQLLLIVLAMVFARTVAMLANRLIDRRIDRDNPRTEGRALPSGRASVKTAVSMLSASAVGFMIVCAAFGVAYGNWWPMALSVPVLAWVSAYGYLKRFTSLCHLYLGSSLAISPLAAALAIEPSALTEQPALWLLSGMVLVWVAGFDIIYALQDVEIDRRQGLFSIPSRLGERGGLWISRGLHAIAAGLLIVMPIVDPRLGVVYFSAVAMVVAMLVVEHTVIARRGTAAIVLAFFTLNGIISCALGLAGIADVLVA